MLGKLLTFLNVFAAVGLLTWSLSAYTNRLNWVDQKTDSGLVKGQITELKEEIDRLAKGVADAQAAYAATAEKLAIAEAVRDYRKGRYAVRLDQARKGTFRAQLPMAGSPGNAVFTNLEQEGQPILDGRGQPLRGVDALAADLARETREAQRLVNGDQELTPQMLTGLDAAIAEDAAFGRLVQPLGITSLRRLHDALSARAVAFDQAVLKQKDIRANLRAEADSLASERVDWSAQLQTLERRQSQLEGRLQGLRGGGR